MIGSHNICLSVLCGMYFIKRRIMSRVLCNFWFCCSRRSRCLQLHFFAWSSLIQFDRLSSMHLASFTSNRILSGLSLIFSSWSIDNTFFTISSCTAGAVLLISSLGFVCVPARSPCFLILLLKHFAGWSCSKRHMEKFVSAPGCMESAWVRWFLI